MGTFLLRGWIGLGLLALCWGCVGAKKYKTLSTQNAKTERTFLETKTELAQAKLELNKLRDASRLKPYKVLRLRT